MTFEEVTTFSSKVKKLAPEALFDYAVRALARRALTERELRTKLERRAVTAGDLDTAVERVRRVGYLDDGRTAEQYARARKEINSLGRRRVLNDLRRRGVDAALAERTVEEAYRNSDETELIRAYLRRKLGRRIEERIEDPKEVAKLYRGLLRAGFSSAKIGEALGKVAADSEWLEGFEEESAELDSAG